MREKWTEENEALTIYFELNRLVVGCYRCNTEGLTTPRYMNEHHDLCRRTGCTNVMTHIEIVKIISLFVAVCWLFCRCNRWLKVIFHFAFIAMAFVMSPLCKRQKKNNKFNWLCVWVFYFYSIIYFHSIYLCYDRIISSNAIKNCVDKVNFGWDSQQSAKLPFMYIYLVWRRHTGVNGKLKTEREKKTILLLNPLTIHKCLAISGILLSKDTK